VFLGRDTTVAGSSQYAVFGRRKEPHTVIIARGNDVRHFTVRPWAAALAGSALAAVAVGYLLATSYLVLRDDLIGATIARQARMQQAYEDRITALRAQVDRITSRQLLDQQLMENKVGELLDRQSKLNQRHGRLGAVLERAAGEGLTPEAAPVPAAKPDTRAEVAPSPAPAMMTAYAAEAPRSSFPAAFWNTPVDTKTTESSADRADRLFVSINQSLRSIESEQIDKIKSLTEDAYETADTIADALGGAGLKLDIADGAEGVGGPFVAPTPELQFDAEVAELDEALATLDKVKAEARKLPIGNPAPGQPVSSSFGVRRDPLLGVPAMHAGMDFRAGLGLPVHVTAPGTVVKAGWNGGYGRMVEVDHGGGLTTRYAHMSRIEVTVGDKLASGAIVGEVGSSGRSTGPHLHYEVRREGEATDPLRFLKAGRKIAGL
jgi:murein DD-endopeptidase MepM/ murein hydrolase activator NlpD